MRYILSNIVLYTLLNKWLLWSLVYKFKLLLLHRLCTLESLSQLHYLLHTVVSILSLLLKGHIKTIKYITVYMQCLWSKIITINKHTLKQTVYIFDPLPYHHVLLCMLTYRPGSTKTIVVWTCLISVTDMSMIRSTGKSRVQRYGMQSTSTGEFVVIVTNFLIHELSQYQTS